MFVIWSLASCFEDDVWEVGQNSAIFCQEQGNLGFFPSSKKKKHSDSFFFCLSIICTSSVGLTNMVFFCFTSNCEVKHQKEKKTAKKTSGSKNNFTETKKNLKKTGKGEMFSPERQTILICKQLRRIPVKKWEEPSGTSFCQIMSNWFCFEIRTSTYILHEYSK